MKNTTNMQPQPFHTGYLAEQDGHRIYFAQYGNPNGETIISLHGGPGGKSRPSRIQRYDLEKYRVIIFDQRGCGKSLPVGEIRANTLSDLIADIERIRVEVGVNQWFVAGGSWGAALALAYAQTHPSVVKGLLLSSVFLARPKDISWAFTEKNGVATLFPDLWEKRLEFLKRYKATPENAAKVLLQTMQTADLETVKTITAGVSNWERNLMNALEDVSLISPEDVTDEDIAETRIFLHYEAHHFFLKPDQLLHNLHTISAIPTIIVHGRYDVLCPVEQTWELQKGFAQVEVIILPTSNHRLTAEGDVAKGLAFRSFLLQNT